MHSTRPFLAGHGATLVGAFVAAVLLMMNAPAHAQSGACAKSVQGRVPFDAKGSTKWPEASVNALCAGAEQSNEPGICYQHVMTSRSVNWGGGTTWTAANALKLCAGANSAQRRVSCFESAIARKVPWAKAVEECVRAEQGGAQGAQAGAAAPAAAAPRAEASDAQAKSKPSLFRCIGPLELSLTHSGSASAGQVDLVMRATAAESAARIQPGQCWREDGWDFPRSVGTNRALRVQMALPLGNCQLFTGFKLTDGRLVDRRYGVRGIGATLAEALFDGATTPGRAFRIDTRFLFGPSPVQDASVYEVFATEPFIKPECR